VSIYFDKCSQKDVSAALTVFHNGEGFGGLVPQNKFQARRIEIWNSINQWSFCQFLECQAPLLKRNAPLLKTFWRWFWASTQPITQADF